MNRQLQSKAISVVNLFSVIQLLKALETRHISECFSSCPCTHKQKRRQSLEK